MSEVRSLTGVILQFRNSSGSNDSAGFEGGDGGGDIDSGPVAFAGVVVVGDSGGRRLFLLWVVVVGCGGNKVWSIIPEIVVLLRAF